MGKGDKKTKRGKIVNKSYGVLRKRKKKKIIDKGSSSSKSKKRKS